MFPLKYKNVILPKIEERWLKKCFCENGKFQKLVSFNFQDYGHSPAALGDAEILIDKLIRRKFESISIEEASQGITIQVWKCSQCGSICKETYSEFSINMMRSYIEYEEKKIANDVFYMIGYYGFDVCETTKFNGFEQTESEDIYLSQFDTYKEF